MDGYYLLKSQRVMKQLSVKAFFICIIGLSLTLGILEWVHDVHFHASPFSPILRIKMAILIIVGIAIMKLSLPTGFFKIFLVIYLLAWIIYYLLNHFLVRIMPFKYIDILNAYRNITQLLTPLPFIFFWFLSRLSMMGNNKE